MIKKWLPIVIATVAGVIVLLGYLLPGTLAGTLRDRFLEWAIILVAFAFLLGLLNILRVHGARVARTRRGWFNSLILMVTVLVAAIPSLMGPFARSNLWLIRHILTPLGAAVAGLMVFTLAFAAFRMLWVRRSLWAILFLSVVAIALLGSVPLVGLQWLSALRDWLVAVPGMAGTRGLLLGVSLGTVVMALRVLLAGEHPHTES